MGSWVRGHVWNIILGGLDDASLELDILDASVEELSLNYYWNL